MTETANVEVARKGPAIVRLVACRSQRSRDLATPIPVQLDARLVAKRAPWRSIARKALGADDDRKAIAS